MAIGNYSGQQRTNAAITRAEVMGVSVNVVYEPTTFDLHIRALHRSTGRALKEVVRSYDHYATTVPQDQYVADHIKRMTDSLCNSAGDEPSADFKQKYAALQVELARYKDTVKKLAFDLEMARGNGGAAFLAEAECRRIALQQASEFVMDWGVPKDGHDLAELCEQITRIPRNKGLPDE